MKIFFEKGLLGLESYKNYDLQDIKGNNEYKVLNCLDNKEISLVVMSPFNIKNDYEINLSEEVIKHLKIESKDEVTLFTTVILNSDYRKMTTNLRAPIVINEQSLLGEQIILPKDSYEIKHPIYKEEADVSNY